MKNAVSKILILVIIAILVSSGFFVWQKWGKEWFTKEKKPQLPPGIEVIEQGDKKIVRNTVEGYEVTVPKELRVEIINRGMSGQNLRLRDELVEQQATPSEIIKGCVTEIFVNQNQEKLTLDQWIEQHAPGGITSRENIIIGANIPAIRITGNELGSYIIVYALNSQNNNIHEIVLYLNEPNITICIDNFNKMLTTYFFK